VPVESQWIGLDWSITASYTVMLVTACIIAMHRSFIYIRQAAPICLACNILFIGLSSFKWHCISIICSDVDNTGDDVGDDNVRK